MSEAFRVAVRQALADAYGGPLARRIVAGTTTAIVADACGDVLDDVALEEVSAALVRAGVPRGRQFVLLGSEVPAVARAGARASGLRAQLGIPVIAHDPDGPCYVAGHLPDGRRVEFDDELREAEEVLFVGRCMRVVPDGRGGTGTVWPGVAGRASRGDADGAPAGSLDAVLASITVRDLLPVDFALVWNGEGPLRVRAGTPATAVASCWADDGS